ncbi:transcriptional regulator [Arthrobacter sp. ATA002]|uniref:transcriptional regulator n=1 Tax=Arthrobacter sp. ATA002 TaxID=2991715 RepID=UPI0022A79C74|nr:transcriptional regulator [Arthrobacter sp. ATA002]WAP50464.1 transcriptional regulator [Arthrobacter sp. ATA002]
MTVPEFNSVIHPEQRIRICAFLLANEEVAFSILRDGLGLSESALSRQLKVLAEAGFAVVTREKGVPRPRAWVALTPAGRRAVRGHLAALRAMAGQADSR